MKTNKIKNILTALIIAGTFTTTTITTYAATNKTSVRLGGANRYTTAIEIAKEYSKAKLNNVILASGNDFPDSLSASALSKKLNAPILLINKNAKYSQETLNYVKSNINTNGTVYLLGSTGVVSDDIISNLKTSGFKNFKRLGGANRFETNILINDELNAPKGTPVIVANSHSFADALSISSVSGINNMPIYITRDKSIDANTLAEIKEIAPSKIYIVGSSGVVSSNIENTLKGITSDITRLGGADRYETSRIIANHFNLNTNNAVITLGTNFPDALAGSAIGIKYNAPILLIRNDKVAEQKAYLDKTNISNYYVLGSTGVITDNVVNTLKTNTSSYWDDSLGSQLRAFYVYGGTNDSDGTSSYSSTGYSKFMDAAKSYVRGNGSIDTINQILNEDSELTKAVPLKINTYGSFEVKGTNLSDYKNALFNKVSVNYGSSLMYLDVYYNPATNTGTVYYVSAF